jgi:hypothetical protein
LYIAVIFFLILLPTSFFEKEHTVCLIKNIFGVSCPGCGMTRAVSSIFHGRFIEAFHYNKLVVIVFPLLCYINLKILINRYKHG